MYTVVILEYNVEQAAEQSNMAIGSFEAKFSIWIYMYGNNMMIFVFQITA